MTAASNPALEPRRVPGTENTRGERAFQALLACAFLKQQMDLRIAVQQLSRQDRRLRSLAATQDEIRGREMDGVLSLLVERTLAITGANGATIALAEQRGVVCRASCGNAPGVGTLIDPESGFSGLAILTGEILRCEDTQSDDRVDAAGCAQLGIRSLVGVPLVPRKNNVMGLLEVFSDKPHTFGDREINVLRLVAGFALEALQTGTPAPPTANDLSRTVATQVIALPEHPKPGPPVEEPDERRMQENVTASWSTVEPNILAAPDEDEEKDRGKFLPAIITLVFVAALIAGGFAWKYFAARKHPPITTPEPKTNQFVPASPVQVPVTSAAIESGQAQSTAATPVKAEQGSYPRVTDIRHWSTAQSSTVVIELERELPFLAHRLHGPERIYLDLQGSQLAPELTGKNFDVSDGIVDKIRIASPQSGVSRIVLDTKGEHEFTTSVSTQPFRVIVEIRR